jgi:O-antigen ligase
VAGTSRDVPSRLQIPLLFVALAWPLAAFGGTSAAAAVPYGVACLLFLALARPAIGGPLDRSVALVAAVVLAQCLPVPRAVATFLSPHRAELDAALTLGGSGTGWRPLTIHRSSTLWALLVVVAAVALFWIARAQFRHGGIRRTVQMVSALGGAVALLAIAQAATAGRNIYWRFPTEFEGPLPFGPFVNRNHFATWVIMALPLCLGYIAARTGPAPRRWRHVSRRSRLAEAIDPRTAWLLAAALVMAVALLLSLSRSGMLALASSGAITLTLSRAKLDQRRRRTLLAATAVIVVLGLAWADVPALRGRISSARSAIADRAAIWRETLPVVRDFWATGTGAGTYQRAMYVYQRSDRTVFFNQAHNHYLQVIAEGGIALVAALAYALLSLARTIAQRIAADTSGLVWIRIGAASGLGAVALQSVWETGLVMPANAALAALLAAIAVHSREELKIEGLND